jgi:lipopolysaccharide transport system ATP-binding protein
MTQPAIRVEGLGKKYQITHETRGRYKTLRETVMDAAAAPVRWMKGERGTTQEEFWALKDVSFEVQPGEVVGIIGRNGAGKSTLLKVLSRITKPTKGRVELNGRVGSLLEVGTGFHPELTGRENVYLNGSILGMTRREIEKKFDEIVAFAEVEKFLDTPVKRYSSGMYVRLAFAVAAHLEPEILIVDEVLAVGDSAFQTKCLNRMKLSTRNGHAVLFVSHNMGVVESLCKSAILLSHGAISDAGPAPQVVQRYVDSQSGQGLGTALSSASAFFRDVRLLDGDGQPTSVISTGDDFTILLDVVLPRGIRHPIFGVNITSAAGVRVCTLSNLFTDVDFDVPDGGATLRCEVQNLPLVAGFYSLRLGFDAAGGVSERLDDAMRFEVIGRAMGGTSIPGSVHGVVSPCSAWSLDSSSIATI